MGEYLSSCSIKRSNNTGVQGTPEDSTSLLTSSAAERWTDPAGCPQIDVAIRPTRTLSEPDGICSSGLGQHPATALAPPLGRKTPKPPNWLRRFYFRGSGTTNALTSINSEFPWSTRQIVQLEPPSLKRHSDPPKEAPPFEKAALVVIEVPQANELIINIQNDGPRRNNIGHVCQAADMKISGRRML